MPWTYVGGVKDATASISYSPTVGNMLIVFSATTAGGGSPLLSVTDNIGSKWLPALPTTAADIWFAGAWYLPRCPAGITTITLSYNGGAPSTLRNCLVEYSGGPPPSIPLNTKPAAFTFSTAVDGIVAPSIYVTPPPAMVVAFCGDISGTGTTAVAGTGYTSRFTTTQTQVEDARFSSAGVRTPTFTDTTTGATDSFVVMTLAFSETPKYNPSRGSTLPSIADPADQDYKSELTILRWF